jgi:hypothetical protein
MEPLKINIEVSLSEATIAALKGIFGAQIIAAPAKVEEPAPEPKKAAKKAEPAPAPQPEPAPAPTVDDDDLPPSNAELAEKAAAAAVPTEAEMRAAIQATRKRGVAAKTIRQYIHDTFGVETSVECPESRRQELIDGLAKLAA